MLRSIAFLSFLVVWGVDKDNLLMVDVVWGFEEKFKKDKWTLGKMCCTKGCPNTEIEMREAMLALPEFGAAIVI